MNTREKLHNLVNQIKDEKLLEGYLKLLEFHAKEVKGKLWNSLTEAEREELLLSYEESYDDNNLLKNDDVKKTLKKWL